MKKIEEIVDDLLCFNFPEPNSEPESKGEPE
jgi:hypothetical protein